MTKVERWTLDHKVKQLILHLGHDSYQNSSHLFKLSPAQYSFTPQNSGLNHHPFNFISSSFISTQRPPLHHMIPGLQRYLIIQHHKTWVYYRPWKQYPVESAIPGLWCVLLCKQSKQERTRKHWPLTIKLRMRASIVSCIVYWHW